MAATQEKATLTKLEAMKELAGYDHAYLTPEGAQRIAEPFGLKLTMQKQTANRTNRRGQFIEPKGLFIDNVPNNTKVEGYDARDLADFIARHEGVQVPSMFGRGSGLRAATGAMIEHLTKIEGVKA